MLDGALEPGFWIVRVVDDDQLEFTTVRLGIVGKQPEHVAHGRLDGILSFESRSDWKCALIG